MELTKSQERRLSFVASLLSLNPNDPTDRIKALRHLNLDEEGCFHGFQYSQGNLEFFIFLDESTPLERVVTNLTQDLKQLRVALCRTSEPKNPFFASLSEEADPWDVVKINADGDEESDEAPASRPYMETLEITVLRTRASRDITDSELERTLKDMRRKLKIWKDDVQAKLEIIAEHDDLTKDLRSADDKLEIQMVENPLHMVSDHGELFLGFCPIRTIYDYHMNLGKRLKTKHNMAIVSSNIRTYLGNLTHTNAALIDAFQEMEKEGDSSDFPFFHNGMTLTGDDLRLKDRDGRKVLQIERPKIINGAQSLFTYEQYAKKSKNPVNPNVLVKVVVPYPGADSFLRQVTMANNRQNPVYSYHLRAADDLQFFIWQRYQEEGFTYVYKDGFRLKARTRKLEVRMRPELAKTLLMMDAKISESKSYDCIFDKESLYQRSFGAFLRVSPKKEKDFVRKTIVYTKAWQLLVRLQIKVRNIMPGKGVSIEANDDNPLTRITWNGRLEDKFLFRSAVRDLVVALALRHWLIYGDPIKDFESLVENELIFHESILKYASKIYGEHLKQVLVSKFKDNPAYYDTITTIDKDSGESVERRLWKGFGNTATYEKMLDYLEERDPAWAKCRGGIEDFL
ncbi:MAG: AIPR family protein [Fibrobacteraceae bacterium]|jgi:hypothetical protein|nr:AIPR family protein [Fibrobacteraceae bacterium]